jgi:hypothetical protein
LHRRWNFVVNHRDGAVGVVDQPGADRTEQAATQRAAAPAPDHLGLLGQIDKCRHGRRKEHRLDLGPSTFCGAVFDELDRVGHDLCGFVFLPLAQFGGNGNSGPRQGR